MVAQAPCQEVVISGDALKEKGLSRLPVPWLGENAIHKSAKVLDKATQAAQSQPKVEINSLTFTSSLQVTKINGGVAANVIPDECVVTINHRYTPDVSAEQAAKYVCDEIASDADEIEVTNNSPGAMPAFDHPLVAFAEKKPRA